MIQTRELMEKKAHHLPALVRTRLIAPPGSGRSGGLDRVSWLTPYTAETIGQEARRAGAGARLEVAVPKQTSAAAVAAVESLFAWLGKRGVTVSVRRYDDDD